MVKPIRQSLAGHVAWFKSNRVPVVFYRSDLEGRRGVDQLKMRWIDGIEQDLGTLRVWNSALFQTRTENWLIEPEK